MGCKQRSSQKGLALLSVLLMLTLGIVLVAAMTEKMQTLVRSAGGLQRQEQSQWYTLSAEQLAMKALHEDFEDNSKVVHLDQNWATEQRELPIGDATLNGHVRDLQGCFNLNALSHPDKTGETEPTHRNIKVFQALLEGFGVDTGTAEQIAQASRDWVFPKTEPISPLGADDADYLSLPVAYLASNTDMRDESEWRSVRGVNSRLSQAVMPYLCAIPEHELRINVNTLPKEHAKLLAALFLNQIPEDQALEVLNQRPEKGWETVQDFLAEPALNGVDTTGVAESLAVTSTYFEVDARVTILDDGIRVRTLMMRGKDGKMTVIRRRTAYSG